MNDDIKNICNIAEEIRNHNGVLFLVGGCVRDQLMGYKSKDYDIEIYGLYPIQLENILSKFGDINFIGKSYGIYKLDYYDISIPRRDRKIGSSHKEFEVSVDPFMSYKDACERRDITINAILYNPLTYEYIDPFNGIQDIRDKKIKHVNIDTFKEDPLRVLRVTQFSARFNFKVDEETKILCSLLKNELKFLSKERVFIELEKILMKAEKPSIGFNFLKEIGVLKKLFPEIDGLSKIEQGRKHHPEGNVYNHIMLMLDYFPIHERTLDLMLGILCHDLGKAVVRNVKHPTDPDIIHSYGHAEAGVEVAEKFLNKFTNETKLIESVLKLVKYHMHFYNYKNHCSSKSIRKLALKVDFEKLLKLHDADSNSRGLVDNDYSYMNKVKEVYNQVKNNLGPIILGRHLIEYFNMTPNKKFGEILKLSYEAQLNEKFDNVMSGLDYIKKNILNRV